jgi:O-antigen/teichoic acid export membrane protein
MILLKRMLRTNPYVLEKFRSKKIVIYNSLWVILDKVFRMIGGVVVGIWFARYLGPYDFGGWNYAYSLVNFFVPLINLGLFSIILTELIKNSSKSGTILFTGLVLKIISGTAATLLLILFSMGLKNEEQTRIILIILSFQSIFQAFDVFDIFYQARTQSKNSIIAKTSAYVLISVLKIFLLINRMSIYYFAVLTVLEVVIGSGILLMFYFKVSAQKISTWKFDGKLAVNLLKLSWPMIISEMLIVVYTRLDQVMLKNMVGNIELGRYSAAIRLSEIWYFIGVAINVSLYPSILKLRQNGEEAFLAGFQKLFNLLCLIAVFIALVTTLLGNMITDFFYGEKYPGLGGILAIHIWTGVFVSLGVASANWFVVNNLQKYFLIRTLSGVIVNAVLNLLLIPSLGGIGAAIATLAGQFFSSVLSNAFSQRTMIMFRMQLKAIRTLFRPDIKNYI